MSPSTTPEEPIVSIRTPMPRGYSFVPKGDRYITSHCRAQTHSAGQAVYVVHDPRRRAVSGLRVPQRIYAAVLRAHKKTLSCRARATFRRDENLRSKLRAAILIEFPRVPAPELCQIIDWTMRKGARRVGRSSKLDARERARLAVWAYIRHVHTEYDILRTRGAIERGVAREKTFVRVEDKAREWGWISKAGATREGQATR
ncbi:hypothetical protein F5X99DRAFT_274679 [Biscogniauxia marginata]|nr:hypothetical protein F5X99DRAFT_274679 [Biscogniauxia marginata]